MSKEYKPLRDGKRHDRLTQASMPPANDAKLRQPAVVSTVAATPPSAMPAHHAQWFKPDADAKNSPAGEHKPASTQPTQTLEQAIISLIECCKLIRKKDLGAQISLATLLIANPKLLSIVKKYFRLHFDHLFEIAKDTGETELVKFFAAADEGIAVNISPADKRRYETFFLQMLPEQESIQDVRENKSPDAVQEHQQSVAIVRQMLRHVQQDEKACRQASNELLLQIINNPTPRNLPLIAPIAKAGGNVNYQADGFPLLFLAVLGGTIEAVEALLKEPNIDIHATNEGEGFTVLEWAVAKGNNALNDSLIQLLLDKGCKASATMLGLAAGKGVLSAVKLLCAAKADINGTVLREQNKSNPLMKAIEGGHADVVDFLLQQPGINLTYQNTVGFTALHLAIHLKKLGIVKALLSPKYEHLLNAACINLKDERGFNALHTAICDRDCEEVVPILIQRGADILCIDAEGFTVLHSAMNASISVVDQLLAVDKGGKLLLTTWSGVTALHLAVLLNRPDCVRRLLTAGKQHQQFDVNASMLGPGLGYSALVLALAMKKGVEIVKILLEYPGISIELPAGLSFTLLDIALFVLKDLEIYGLLLAHKTAKTKDSHHGVSLLLPAEVAKVAQPPSLSSPLLTRSQQPALPKEVDDKKMMQLPATPPPEKIAAMEAYVTGIQEALSLVDSQRLKHRKFTLDEKSILTQARATEKPIRGSGATARARGFLPPPSGTYQSAYLSPQEKTMCEELGYYYMGDEKSVPKGDKKNTLRFVFVPPDLRANLKRTKPEAWEVIETQLKRGMIRFLGDEEDGHGIKVLKNQGACEFRIHDQDCRLHGEFAYQPREIRLGDRDLSVSVIVLDNFKTTHAAVKRAEQPKQSSLSPGPGF